MPVYNVRDARLRTASVFASIALLSACGGNPEPADNAAAITEEALGNVTNIAEVADNAAAVNEAAPVAETPAEAPAPVPEAAPAPAPAAAAPEPAETASAGDAANGAKLFVQCRICHSVEPGKNGLGPSLHAVVGRKAGVLEGFNFSTAMQSSNVVWNDATLDEYLRAPMKFIPGTKMAFAGMSNDTQRADMVAYLNTLK